MKVFGIAGWSGSGKTTLVVNLLPVLVAKGLRVSTVKHAHHGFDVDQPGKDSYEHRHAGATEVLVSSPRRWALMHELRDDPEPDSTELIRHLSPVDLVLVEGFKQERYDKLEIHRPALGKPLLCRHDRSIVAVASDGDVPRLDIPVLDLNDIGGIATFVTAHCGLA
jgi:molybdopterin-guanine dinucleotide biosynthesis protein B